MANLKQTDSFRTDIDWHNSSQPELPASIISSSVDETILLGQKTANLLKMGSIVGLKGFLGSGKTCFIKGIAAGLGIKERITSPTYTIVSEYRGIIDKTTPVSVYHIDAYRLGNNQDFLDIGGDEIVFGNAISLVEWCEHIPFFIPAGSFLVEIAIMEDEKRHIKIYKTQDPVLKDDKN